MPSVMSERAKEESAEPQGLDADSLLAAMREVVTELHPHLGARAEITLDSSLDRDLGLDSLSRMELLSRLERRFGAGIPETVMANAETARELLPALLAGERRTRGAASVRGREARLDAVDSIPAGASTLLEAVDFHAHHHGDSVHVELWSSHGEPVQVTFADLVDRAERVAAGLVDRGLEPGRSAALMLPTGLDYLAAFLGVQMAGAVPVPIYPPARPSQLEDHVVRHAGILANANVRTLVTFDAALGVSRLLTARVPGLGAVVDVGALAGGARLRERPPLDESSTAFLQYTSGSTGDPKGVVLSHGDVLASLRAMAAALGATPRDVFVSWLPLYHDMGLIGAWMGSLYYGFPLVLMSPLDFLARPDRWLEAIHRHRGTLSGGPNFAYELCVRRVEPEHMEGLDLSSWRIAFNGAEPVSPDTMERFTAKFAPCGFDANAMTPVYGLAEATLGVAFTPIGRGPRVETVDADAIAHGGEALPLSGGPSAHVRRFVSCGPPIPGFEVRIVDDRGTELRERTEGAIEFRGPSTTSGYHRNPARTVRCSTANGCDRETAATSPAASSTSPDGTRTSSSAPGATSIRTIWRPRSAQSRVCARAASRCSRLRTRPRGPSGWWWSRRRARRTPDDGATSWTPSRAPRRRCSGAVPTRSSLHRRTASSRPPAGRSGDPRFASCSRTARSGAGPGRYGCRLPGLRSPRPVARHDRGHRGRRAAAMRSMPVWWWA